MEPRDLGQQTARPAIPAAHDVAQPADLRCSRRGLRVDQARRHRGPIGKGLSPCLCQTTGHQVAKPTVQLGHAARDPLGSLRGPGRGSMRVDDGALRRSSAVGVGCGLLGGLAPNLAVRRESRRADPLRPLTPTTPPPRRVAMPQPPRWLPGARAGAGPAACLQGNFRLGQLQR